MHGRKIQRRKIYGVRLIFQYRASCCAMLQCLGPYQLTLFFVLHAVNLTSCTTKEVTRALTTTRYCRSMLCRPCYRGNVRLCELTFLMKDINQISSHTNDAPHRTVQPRHRPSPRFPTIPLSMLPLVLCRDTADPFFQLLESPYATIASAHTRELDVAQNTVTRSGNLDGELLDGLAFQGVLSRCPADVFEHVQKLSVTWVGWWTLSDAERLSIGQRFKNVTELALWMVIFETDEEFQALVASFPALELISLQTIRFRVKDSEKNHSHAEHTLPANLHTISLNDISNPRVLRSLIPCPSLRVFKCHYVNFGDFTPELAKDVGQLLLSAGECFEDFGFTIQAAAFLNDGVDLGMFLHSTYFSSYLNNQLSKMPDSNSSTSLESRILNGLISGLKTTGTSFLSSGASPSRALRLPCWKRWTSIISPHMILTGRSLIASSSMPIFMC
ncbi:hypothetical protein IW261DRAFT_458367 [Armillaria novae-zelandiae]|uniref:F-box domain-containing protein n=1 Tax=Armillaria novae-zelandiae TaxID=153914 RepID=A0AA39P1F4_9AGAR|nr:hypothetical protein IW261DRAFT_458367 [Armillaria novae-zelandiae]